jgi:phytoene dehydrogenase-like protein
LPHHPLLLASFGLKAVMPAVALANRSFRAPRTKALFAGLAAHSFLSLDEPLSASFGIVLGTVAHTAGWPIPRGGAQSITNALIAHLNKLGGTVIPSHPVESLASIGDFKLALCDVTPRQLQKIAGLRFSLHYNRLLARYRQGPGVFKVDYALSQPIPWKAANCARAATVHLGGTMDEIATSEDAMRHNRHSERPFVLLAQPTLFDSQRAPEGKHIAWAYCHVPNGSTFDMLPRLESQIERFAPGFRDCVLARRVLRSADLEAMDANLAGGDIVGGTVDLWQLLFRPTWRQYATPDRSIYLCSSSTPPGGGVHGMCGYNAATLALSRM